MIPGRPESLEWEVIPCLKETEPDPTEPDPTDGARGPAAAGEAKAKAREPAAAKAAVGEKVKDKEAAAGTRDQAADRAKVVVGQVNKLSRQEIKEVRMPGYDGTGPLGQGPLSGGGWGRCRGGQAGPGRGYGRGYGRGRGSARPWGPGYQARWDAVEPVEPASDELMDRLDRLEDQLAALRDELARKS